MLKLNTIKASPGSVHRRKRLGRGAGSGHGQTSGKGDKGQLARSGGSVRPGFEGGQMPLYRRIPKKGFKNPGRRDHAVINLSDLSREGAFSGAEVTMETLTQAGLIKGQFDRLVVLGTGDVKKAFQVKAHRISASAKAKLEKAGGKVELLPIPGPQPREKKAKTAARAAK